MVHILYQIIVLPGLGVFLQAVAAVTGYRHVVNAEGLVVNVLGHGYIDHFQIAFRPDRGDALQTAVAGIEVIIAQVGVGFVPVIEVGVVVVIGSGEIAQLLQLVAHGQKKILVHRLIHAHPSGGGNHTHHVGEFSRGGAAAPGGLIVVRELDAPGGHAVQRGGQLGINHLFGKGFGGDENQILSLEKTGVLVLPGRGQGVDVAVQDSGAGVGGAFRQRGEIQLFHGVIAVFHFLRLRFCRELGGLLRLCFLRQLRRLGDFKIQLRLRRSAAVDGIQSNAHVETKYPDGGIKIVGF